MVLRLDGNSEIGAHTWSNFGYLICLRRLFRSKAAKNLIFSKMNYLPSDLLSNIDILVVSL